jgi:hypothetical protein
LTYDDDHIPKDRSLHVDDFQKFMKRLRKKYAPKKIRFFHCGEYGDKMGRPHYHACLFGIDFPDRKCYNLSTGNVMSSDTLKELWPFGFNVIGDVTFESAAYVARYITKKVTGDDAIWRYTDIDPMTGEILAEYKPEYVTMSRRPGIAKDWLLKYASDVYPSDGVIVRGKEVKPPKYYDSQFEIIAPEVMKKVKALRKNVSKEVIDNNYGSRLRVREFIQKEKFKQKKRGYENGNDSFRNL